MPADWAARLSYINDLARLRLPVTTRKGLWPRRSCRGSSLRALVKQAGWAMLSLGGAEGNTAPLLSELHDRLVAASSPSCR